MPVYEYKCGECDERFEMFLRSAARRAVPTCPKCGSPEVRKAISLCGVGGTSGSGPMSDISCGPGPV